MFGSRSDSDRKIFEYLHFCETCIMDQDLYYFRSIKNQEAQSLLALSFFPLGQTLSLFLGPRLSEAQSNLLFSYRPTTPHNPFFLTSFPMTRAHFPPLVS
ncbi:hypothetical protein Droror1_Dr00023345 [Drosera rotundifolia]